MQLARRQLLPSPGRTIAIWERLPSRWKVMLRRRAPDIAIQIHHRFYVMSVFDEEGLLLIGISATEAAFPPSRFLQYDGNYGVYFRRSRALTHDWLGQEYALPFPPGRCDTSLPHFSLYRALAFKIILFIVSRYFLIYDCHHAMVFPHIWIRTLTAILILDDSAHRQHVLMEKCARIRFGHWKYWNSH